MQLTVSYRGTQHLLSVEPETTLAYFQSELESLTAVPPELQKLLYRGKPPKWPDMDPTEISLAMAGLKDGVKVTLMGSTNAEIDSLQRVEGEKHKRDEIMARRQAQAGFSKVCERASLHPQPAQADS